jgi:hypothetical protein
VAAPVSPATAPLSGDNFDFLAEIENQVAAAMVQTPIVPTGTVDDICDAELKAYLATEILPMRKPLPPPPPPLLHRNQLWNNKVDAVCCISTTTTMNVERFVHTIHRYVLMYHRYDDVLGGVP